MTFDLNKKFVLFVDISRLKITTEWNLYSNQNLTNDEYLERLEVKVRKCLFFYVKMF